MTQRALTQVFHIAPKALDASSIDTGAGVEMFTSGSVAAGRDMMAGDAVEMFTTSILSTTSDAASGDRTGMFTTSI